MRVWGSIVIGLAVAVAGLSAQQPLTPQDYVDIQALYTRYAQGLDAGDAAMFGQVFTADGVLVDESGMTHTGRAQLEAHARTFAGQNIQHYTWNVRIDPSPDGAAGMAYVMMGRLGAAGAPTPLGTGQYRDTIVRTPEGWRIKRREFHRPPAPAQPAAAPAGQPQPAGRGGRGGL
jgi:ketosteroid isomerase-like protein